MLWRDPHVSAHWLNPVNNGQILFHFIEIAGRVLRSRNLFKNRVNLPAMTA